jgi:hypothetical protein
MKVVINKCFGGFGLSNKAVEMCIQKGMTLGDSKSVDYTDWKLRDAADRYYANRGDENSFRCNPIVVEVVETLGDEADGSCARLVIVDIPYLGEEGWHIKSHDGIETIHPDHQSWG